ncbi:MAG: S1 family peptidase [Bacteroidales bacterium]|jgi:hypothetical protein|nr:S1 family peptidase [Bacteroidales bacterium]
MKKFILTSIIAALFYCVTYGQITTREEPVSFRMNISALKMNESTQKHLHSFDIERIRQEDREDETNGIPPRFGYKHEVNYSLDNSGEWTKLPNGDRIWRLAISSEGALSINLLYDKFWIPNGAKFFVYSNDRKQSIGAMTSVNNKGTKNDEQGFATGLIYGDQIILEYYLPNHVQETGLISIAYVVHGYRYILLPDNHEKSSGSCNINVNCPQGQDWQDEKNAVALILVNGNRYCSGSLINTTANDNRPLFLTADHCLGGWGNNYVKYDAITAPNLSHWSFYWHYEAPTCVNALPTTIYSTVGATVVSNNNVSDFALLQLTENPAEATGVTPYYLGWDRSENVGIGGVGIHHPSGDIKKITPYIIAPLSTYYLNNSESVGATHWRVTWSEGTTEGGSSGSPLINSDRRIIGQLHGGYASCNAQTQPDWYGKISYSWTSNNASDNRRKLDSWLDPLDSELLAVDGIGINIHEPIFVTIPDTIGYYSDSMIEIPATVLPEEAAIIEWKWHRRIDNGPWIQVYPSGKGPEPTPWVYQNSWQEQTLIFTDADPYLHLISEFMVVVMTAQGTDTSNVGRIIDYTITSINPNQEPQNNSLKAWSQNGNFYISGLTEGQSWRIYTILGTLIHQGIAKSNVEVWDAMSAPSGTYIIHSEHKFVKIIKH